MAKNKIGGNPEPTTIADLNGNGNALAEAARRLEKKDKSEKIFDVAKMLGEVFLDKEFEKYLKKSENRKRAEEYQEEIIGSIVEVEDGFDKISIIESAIEVLSKKSSKPAGVIKILGKIKERLELEEKEMETGKETSVAEADKVSSKDTGEKKPRRKIVDYKSDPNEAKRQAEDFKKETRKILFEERYKGNTYERKEEGKVTRITVVELIPGNREIDDKVVLKEGKNKEAKTKKADFFIAIEKGGFVKVEEKTDEEKKKAREDFEKEYGINVSYRKGKFSFTVVDFISGDGISTRDKVIIRDNDKEGKRHEYLVDEFKKIVTERGFKRELGANEIKEGALANLENANKKFMDFLVETAGQKDDPDMIEFRKKIRNSILESADKLDQEKIPSGELKELNFKVKGLLKVDLKEEFEKFKREKAASAVKNQAAQAEEGKSGKRKVDADPNNTLSRVASEITLDRLVKYKDIDASTEKERDEKFKEQTRKLWKDLVVHGRVERNKDTGKIEIKSVTDLDGKISLELLKLAGIDISKVQYVAPGEVIPGKLHVDTGNEDGLVILEDGTAIIDHHAENSIGDTSATLHVYNILVELGMLEKEEHIDRLVEFVNQIDNFKYPDSEKYFKNYFKDSWKTLLGIYRMANMKNLTKFFEYKEHSTKEGVSPAKPLSEGLLKKFGFIYGDKNKSESQKERVMKSKEELEKMEKEGFIVESDRYGRVCINIDGRVSCGADAAKAFGCNSFINWNTKEPNFFVTSLDGKKIEDDFVAGRNVRGTMWVRPISDNKYPDVSLGDILEKMTDGKLKAEGELAKFLENKVENKKIVSAHEVEVGNNGDKEIEKVFQVLDDLRNVNNKFKKFIEENAKDSDPNVAVFIKKKEESIDTYKGRLNEIDVYDSEAAYILLNDIQAGLKGMLDADWENEMKKNKGKSEEMPDREKGASGDFGVVVDPEEINSSEIENLTQKDMVGGDGEISQTDDPETIGSIIEEGMSVGKSKDKDENRKGLPLEDIVKNIEEGMRAIKKEKDSVEFSEKERKIIAGSEKIALAFVEDQKDAFDFESFPKGRMAQLFEIQAVKFLMDKFKSRKVFSGREEEVAEMIVVNIKDKF